MSAGAQIVKARIHHARRGGTRNAFTYSADFVLADIDAPPAKTLLFGRNRAALWALLDRDHGAGGKDAASWARGIARDNDVSCADTARLWLLTQPRLFGFVFNPVSFWFFEEDGLRAVIAEVNNVRGERCAYLCAHADGRAIAADEELSARKTMYVSPFQARGGGYRFRFDWRADQVGVRIVFDATEGGGLLASLEGERASLTNGALAARLAARPLGSFGVLALIFWQAIKLRLKGERYRPHRPPASTSGVSHVP